MCYSLIPPMLLLYLAFRILLLRVRQEIRFIFLIYSLQSRQSLIYFQFDVGEISLLLGIRIVDVSSLELADVGCCMLHVFRERAGSSAYVAEFHARFLCGVLGLKLLGLLWDALDGGDRAERSVGLVEHLHFRNVCLRVHGVEVNFGTTPLIFLGRPLVHCIGH